MHRNFGLCLKVVSVKRTAKIAAINNPAAPPAAKQIMNFRAFTASYG